MTECFHCFEWENNPIPAPYHFRVPQSIDYCCLPFSFTESLVLFSHLRVCAGKHLVKNGVNIGFTRLIAVTWRSYGVHSGGN